jgi:anti-sigma factor RsiW
VNHEPRRVSTGEMLAYVDDCLPSVERAAFEGKMVENSEINRQIDLWLLQNEALRAAFPDPFFRRAPASDGGFATRSFAQSPPPQGLKTVRQAKEPDRRPNAPIRASVRLPRPDAARPAKQEQKTPVLAGRLFRILAGAFAFWTAGAFLSRDHSAEFAKAASAAYRTFADNRARPVEMATSDRGALDKWFAAQIPDARPIPDLSASGLVLLGGRIVPGAFSAAQYLLYENPRHERVALQIEAIDAPPETNVEIRATGDVLCASWTGAGRSFALVGDASRVGLAELARLVRGGQKRN